MTIEFFILSFVSVFYPLYQVSPLLVAVWVGVGVVALFLLPALVPIDQLL